jgi:sugar phosphate isomerase/epimerase
MKIGVNSVLFGAFDTETAFKWVKTCGYDAIEISAIHGMSEHLVLQDKSWKKVHQRHQEAHQAIRAPCTGH